MIKKFKVHFIVRAKQLVPEADVPIWVRIRIGRPVDWRLSTSLTIPFKYWDVKRELPKCYTGNNDALAKYLQRIDDKLSRIEYELRFALSTHESFTKDQAAEIIRKIVLDDVIAATSKPTLLTSYCNLVISEMQDGSRLVSAQNGEVRSYSASTIKTWKNFSSILAEFAGKRGLSWESITAKDTAAFVSFVAGRGMLASSANKLITTFKALTVMAAKDGLLANGAIGSELKKISVKGTNGKTAKVYLTEDEVEALYNMTLEPGSLKDQVRDIFCLGCYLCQRISDYNHLSREMFTTTSNGLPVLKLMQQKTKKLVTIPLSLSPHIVEIAEKYDYKLPTVVDQVFNRYIKSICEALAETVPSLNIKVPTTLTAKEKSKESEKGPGRGWEKDRDGLSLVPRWNLVQSHTARRSGITNLYMAGKLTDAEIMAISGHTTQKSFETYLLAGPDRIAERIAEKLTGEVNQ